MKRLIPLWTGLVMLAGRLVAWAQEVSGEGTAPATGDTAASPALGDFFPLIILIVVFGAVFYFMLIRPQRKRQAKMKDLLENLKRGDRVITAGGIHGEIDSIGESAFVLILEDGAKIKIAKTSVVQKREK